MLKITVIETPEEQRLVLEGRLAEPETSELEAAWKKLRETHAGRRSVVDLRSTTFIDQNGEKALLHLRLDGAHFVACGVSTTHRLAELGIRCTSEAKSTH
jgi:anti-anti-sigma regulatory factor